MAENTREGSGPDNVASGVDKRGESGGPVDVVCFGMLTRCQLLVVDAPPVHNGGARIKEAVETYGDDAAIVASLLHQWGVAGGIICTALGDDEAGRGLARQFRDRGVAGEIRLSKQLKTQLEVTIVDPSGGRTYFQQRSPEVLETLGTADLSLLDGARMLYVDWYDGDYILRPMEEASRQGIAVYVNLESRYSDKELLDRLAPRSTICQVSTDEPDAERDPEEVAEMMLSAGAETAIVTAGSRGCLVARGSERIWVKSPELAVVDGNGAGAAFAAGFIFGYLQGWPLEECARFSTAEASLKCGVVGYVAFPASEVWRLANSLRVTRGRQAETTKPPRL